MESPDPTYQQIHGVDRATLGAYSMPDGLERRYDERA